MFMYFSWSIAQAAPVVVDGPDDRVAVERAIAVDPGLRDPVAVAWSGLRTGPPTLLEGGQVLVCEGSANPTWLVTAVADAESRVSYGEWSAALTALYDADRALPCLTGPTPRDTLARLFALRGVANHHAGRPAEASAAFATLRALAPKWTWESALSPAARTAFDAVPVPAATVTLRVLAPTSGSVWVDGVALEGPIAPGWHLVQVDAPSAGFWVAIPTTSRATLVVPDHYPEHLSALFADATRRSDLSSLFAASFGEGAPFAVATEEETGVGYAGRADWGGGPVVAATTIDGQEKHPTRVGLVLAGIGGGIGLGFGGVALQAQLAAGSEADAYQGSVNAEDASGAREGWESASDRLSWSRWVALGGAVLGSAGLGLHIAGAVSVTPVGLGARF